MSTYTADQVPDALGVRRSDLDYLLYTHRLTLASEAPGRLNQRDFFLIDVYALALVFELIRLSGRRDEVCRAVERFLWWDRVDEQDAIRQHRGQPPLTASERIEARRALAATFAADPGAAGDCFKPQKPHEPWFILGYMHEGKMRLEAHRDDGIWLTSVLGLRALWAVNMTRLVADVHASLAAIMEDA